MHILDLQNWPDFRNPKMTRLFVYLSMPVFYSAICWMYYATDNGYRQDIVKTRDLIFISDCLTIYYMYIVAIDSRKNLDCILRVLPGLGLSGM